MDTPVDNVLSQWKAYLTNISSNLMELSDQTEFQLIKAKLRDTTSGYIGLTKSKAEECVESLGALWRYFALLSEVMDKAVKIFEKHIFAYKAEEEVRSLFEKTLIVVDTERIDINDRNLLGSQNKEKKSTPQKLLKQMQEYFEKLCDDVEEISKAEEAVQARLVNIRTEIERINVTVKRLGIKNIPVFDTERVAKVERDPLQGMIELDKLVYSIEKYRASIRSMEEEYNEIVLRLGKVRQMIIELGSLAAKSKLSIIESEKIFGYVKNAKPVISDAVLESLESWLEVLEGKLGEGSVKAVKVGISKLEQECSSKLKLEKENFEVISRYYNEWLDLKGQYKALLAKAEALKVKGLYLGSSLDEIIRDAREEIYSVPVNLDKCRLSVGKLRSNL